VSSGPVILRRAAEEGAQAAVDYYLREVDEDTALGFIDALEQALEFIPRNPAAGSPRYAHELNLPGLRSWPLKGYPHIIFYLSRADHVDVWRILHENRDIPARMR
jgi:toxin ParE1/3/4